MATATDCLPWWHNLLVGVPNPVIPSGCAVDQNDGQIHCSIESMRASAEARLRNITAWGGGPLTQDVYSLARYGQSEVGTDSIEQTVAVIEAAINQAKRRKITPTALLATGGMYGPIQTATGAAPYRRWASTSRDPTLHALLIAKFVVEGGSGDFTGGAEDQDGLESTRDFPSPAAKILYEARTSNRYWVGLLPGVDHWVTTLWRRYPGVSPTSPLGVALIARANETFSNRTRPNWKGLPVCAKGSTGAGRGLMVAEVLLISLTAAGAAFYGWRSALRRAGQAV